MTPPLTVEEVYSTCSLVKIYNKPGWLFYKITSQVKKIYLQKNSIQKLLSNMNELQMISMPSNLYAKISFISDQCFAYVSMITDQFI